MKNFHFLIIGLILLASCSTNEQPNVTEKKITLSESDYNGAAITINQAIEKGYASVSANGQGTYTKLEVTVNNLTNKQLNIELNSGLNFKNPNPEEQSLIITEKIGIVSIQPDEDFKKITSSVCTNVKLHVPGKETGWSNSINNDSKIDEILAMYGKYKPEITKWLQKKNPQKFATEEDQQRFLQVLVWAYTGGNYQEILEMLAKDVYGGDINKAKQWLDGVYDQAKSIVEYVRSKDYKGLLSYIGINEKVEEFMQKNEKTINSVKDRLKGLLSN